LRPDLAAADEIDRGICGDPVKPCCERVPSVELFEGSPGADEGVLGEVERVVLVSENLKNEGVDAGAVARDDFVKGPRIAAACAFEQFPFMVHKDNARPPRGIQNIFSGPRIVSAIPRGIRS